MADLYTTTATISTDQTMWDRGAYYALRPELYWDQFASVKSTNAAPDTGATLTFTFNTDLAAATTPLNESVDVDAVALSDSQTSLTLAEYGNAAITTFRARATSFMALPRTVLNRVGYNAGLSIDTLSRDIMAAGSNVQYATGGANDPLGRTSVDPTDTLTGHDVRIAVARLRARNVATFGGTYAAVIHPDVSVDFREETGDTSWVVPSAYVQVENIWNGEIGRFAGVRFMESPRAPVFSDAGSSTTLTDVYRTIIFGQEALAKAYSTYEGRGAMPIVIVGPVVDKLKRNQPVGWHWFGKYGIFRQEAIQAIESSSTLGTNT